MIDFHQNKMCVVMITDQYLYNFIRNVSRGNNSGNMTISYTFSDSIS